MASSTEIQNATYDPANQAVRVENIAGSSATPTFISDGRKLVTTAGTAVALAATTAIKSVVITALTNNTGIISVGGSTVLASLASRRGTPLNAGESIGLDIADLASVFIDSTVSGEGVTYTYVA